MNIKRSNIEVSPPARIISVSFAMVILIGTILLSLPIATKSGDATPIIDALFTATSATCVTGLIIYDTFTHWSMFGQCVILALIQVGGLGLVTLATFFNLIVGKKIGIRNMQLAKESVSTNSVADVNKMVRIVMGFSFSAELVGALVLATTFVPQYGAYGIFMSIFMSVSAFCNAGFDVCGMQGEFVSLTNYTDNYVVIATISLLIVVGGLGFIVWNNLMEYRKNKRLVLHTKIVLIITGVLITFGTIVFIVFEWNNATTMGGLSIPEKISAAIFQSISCRTAGFNSIPLAPLSEGSKVFSSLFMFIGAAPGSTGGGIKVTTLAVILMTVFCVARGQEETVIAKRRVPFGTVYRAITIMFFGVAVVSITTGILMLTSPIEQSGMTVLDAVYEVTSAFATTGLSVGPTSVATFPSKLALVLTMYIGRVGPVSFALAMSLKRSAGRKEIMPEAKIIVG